MSRPFARAGVNGGRPLPWHDTPQCDKPECGGPMVPTRHMPNGYGGPIGTRIACSACGHGRVGTSEEVAQAERAARAWEAYEDGTVHTDKGCEGCNCALPLDRHRLCAACVRADVLERQGSLFG